MKLAYLFIFEFFFATQAKFYNIIASDGGGIRGLIPVQVLKNMETYAYDYAVKNGYQVPKYLDANGKEIKGVIHVKDLFDMMAGTSAGSQMFAILSCPSDNDPKSPKYFAKDAENFYLESRS